MTPTVTAGASCSGATSKVTWATSDKFRTQRVACRTCPIVRLRRSEPTMSAASCVRRSCCRHARTSPPTASTPSELRVVEDEAIRDVVQAPGGRGPAVGDRRRVPPRVLAHGLHLPARRDLEVARQPERQVPQRRRRHRVHAGGDAHRRQGDAREADLRRATSSSCEDVDDRRHAQAHDPEPEHGPLPRRAGGDREVGLPRHGRVLERPDDRLRRPGRGDGRARLHVPAVRRHQPRLPQRPQPARRDGGQGRRRRAPARELHPPHQRGARPAPRGHGDHHPHVPRQLPLLAGWPRAATTSSPRRCSTSSPSTASSWSGTTPAAAASSRCASCPRTRSSCSAW